MTEREKERLRNQIVRQFSGQNRRWAYNGAEFVMEGDFGIRGLRVNARFRNREDGVELEMRYCCPWDVPALTQRFTGEDRFGQAIDAIVDYLERIGEVVLPLQSEQAERMQEYRAKISAAVSSIAEGKL